MSSEWSELVSSNEHRKRVHHFNIAGHAHFLTFSCYQRLPLLTNDLWRTWLAESITTAGSEHCVALWAYVFMPEHVHLLVKPLNEAYDISSYLKSVKLSTSKRIINSLVHQPNPLLERMRVRERPGKGCFRLWQEGCGHDRNIGDVESAVKAANYCHLNPVKRGLVSDPLKWKWSSVRCLELGKRDGEPLVVAEWRE